MLHCRPFSPPHVQSTQSARDQFLQHIARELDALPLRGDGAVHRVVAEVQKRFFSPPLAVD
jgi:hypothetical protein